MNIMIHPGMQRVHITARLIMSIENKKNKAIPKPNAALMQYHMPYQIHNIPHWSSKLSTHGEVVLFKKLEKHQIPKKALLKQ